VAINHLLNVRDKPAFLTAMLQFLAGNARVSFEGDLSACRFGPELVPSSAETPCLKRATLRPQLDFVVLPLEEQYVQPILMAVLPAGRRIMHIQVEKSGVLELGAYDNFHADCVVTGSAISVRLLEELKARRILRSFQKAKDNAKSKNP
jgi:hypothetical protein